MMEMGAFADAPEWLTYIVAAIVAAKVITPLTPTKHDDKVLDTVFKFLNVVALNVGKDKNADEVDEKAGKKG